MGKDNEFLVHTNVALNPDFDSFKVWNLPPCWNSTDKKPLTVDRPKSCRPPTFNHTAGTATGSINGMNVNFLFGAFFSLPFVRQESNGCHRAPLKVAGRLVPDLVVAHSLSHMLFFFQNRDPSLLRQP